jgi:hypothetical protein
MSPGSEGWRDRLLLVLMGAGEDGNNENDEDNNEKGGGGRGGCNSPVVGDDDRLVKNFNIFSRITTLKGTMGVVSRDPLRSPGQSIDTCKKTVASLEDDHSPTPINERPYYVASTFNFKPKRYLLVWLRTKKATTPTSNGPHDDHRRH